MSSNSTKKTASVLFGAIGFVVAYMVVKSFFNPSPEEVMQKVEIEMNKKCPAMVDEFTRLDSVAVPKDTRNLQYYYTLIGIDADEIDFSLIEGNILETIKTSPEMNELKKYEVTFDYKYYNSDKNKVAEINVVPSQYKE